MNLNAAGATPLGQDGIGNPAIAQDTQGGLNVLIDNATGPGNGYDLSGAGDLQDFLWNGSSWQATDVTTATGSPIITKYPTVVRTPQGYVYTFAAQA